MHVSKPATTPATVSNAKTNHKSANNRKLDDAEGKPTKHRSSNAIGFLTAVESEGAMVGGYLVINFAARPLEFHCTAPVRATRTQEILYGPTLRPFLLGEQIGGALLAKAKSTPQFVVTDLEHMLAVRAATDIAVACIVEHSSLELGEFPLAMARGFDGDSQTLADVWPSLGDGFDLAEPFGRIREAIGEAQKSRKAA